MMSTNMVTAQSTVNHKTQIQQVITLVTKMATKCVNLGGQATFVQLVSSCYMDMITYSPAFPCVADATVCTSRPCLNGGVCNVTAAGFKCTCSPGLVGSVCEHGGICYCGHDVCTLWCDIMTCLVDVSSCGRYPCRNGGTCRNVPNDYVCVCADGFTGKQCEEGLIVL